MDVIPVKKIMQPQISYLVCGTPRCGSSLLCEALKNTGIAGRPEEYFWRGDESFWKEHWGTSTYADYLTKAIEQGTTPNGIFGAKLMYGYFDDFVNKIRSIPDYSEKPLAMLLPTLFPNLHYIWIWRQDKLRQAISHWRAIQTNIWVWSTDEPSVPVPEPKFDFAAINQLLQEITAHDAAWQHYFKTCGVQPLTVIYEDFVIAYEETALHILKYLEITYPENLVFAERKLKRQADALSEEWVQRYRNAKQEKDSLW